MNHKRTRRYALYTTRLWRSRWRRDLRKYCGRCCHGRHPGRTSTVAAAVMDDIHDALPVEILAAARAKDIIWDVVILPCCLQLPCPCPRWQENTPHYQGPHSLLAASQMILTYDPDEAGEDLRVTRTTYDAPSATMCNLSDTACLAVVTKGLDARKDCDT